MRRGERSKCAQPEQKELIPRDWSFGGGGEGLLLLISIPMPPHPIPIYGLFLAFVIFIAWSFSVFVSTGLCFWPSKLHFIKVYRTLISYLRYNQPQDLYFGEMSLRRRPCSFHWRVNKSLRKHGCSVGSLSSFRCGSHISRDGLFLLQGYVPPYGPSTEPGRCQARQGSGILRFDFCVDAFSSQGPQERGAHL